MAFLITTTGTLDPVVFNDLGGGEQFTFPHETVNFDLSTLVSEDEIVASEDVFNAIAGGHITVDTATVSETALIAISTTPLTPTNSWAEVGRTLWSQSTFFDVANYKLEAFVTHAGGRDIELRVINADTAEIYGSGVATATGVLLIALTKPIADAQIAVEFRRVGNGQTPTLQSTLLFLQG